MIRLSPPPTAILLLLFLLFLVFLSTAEGIRLRRVESSMKRLAMESKGLKASLRQGRDWFESLKKPKKDDNVEEEEVCTDTKVECQAEELVPLSEEFTELSEELETKFEGLDDVFSSIDGTEDSVTEVAGLRSKISPILLIAGNIPYVGPLFKVCKTVVDKFKIPLDSMKSKFKTLQATLSKPWKSGIGKFVELVGSIGSVLVENADNVLGIVKMLQPGRTFLVRETLGTFVCGFESAIKAFEDALGSTLESLKSIISAMKELKSITNSAVMKGFMSTTKAVAKVVRTIASPFKKLSPLSDFMDKKITVPWIGKFYFKKSHGSATKCPEGYSESGAFCFSKCPEGYSGADFLCWRNCPKGYPDHGMACVNPTFRGKGWSKKWDKPKPKEDYSGTHLAWFRKCKSYTDPEGNPLQADTKGGAYCYAKCPEGFSSDITKRYCQKKSKERKRKSKICGPGRSGEGGICYSKCDEGEVDLGLSCVKMTEKSFTIGGLAEDFNKMLKEVKNIPGIKQLFSGVEALLKQILKPMLDSLNLPDPSSLVDFNLPSVGAFPIQGLVDKLSSISLTNIFGKVDVFSNVGSILNNIPEKLNLPAGFNVSNFHGILSEFFPDLGAAFPSTEGLNKMKDDLLGFTSELDGSLEGILLGSACKSYKNVTVPVTKRLKDVLGLPCFVPGDLKLELCSKIDFGGPLEPVKTLFKKIKHLFDGKGSSFLESHSATRKFDEIGYNIGLSIAGGLTKVLMKLLLPQTRFSTRFWDSPSVKIMTEAVTSKKRKEKIGGFLDIKPNIYLDMEFGRTDGTNRDYIDFSAEFKIKLVHFKGTNAFYSGMIAYEDAALAWENTIDRMPGDGIWCEFQKTDTVKNFQQLYLDDGDGNAPWDKVYRNIDILNCVEVGVNDFKEIKKTCNKLCEAWLNSANIYNWKYNGNKLLKDYFIDNPSDSLYWSSAAGLKESSYVFSYLYKTKKKIGELAGKVNGKIWGHSDLRVRLTNWHMTKNKMKLSVKAFSRNHETRGTWSWGVYNREKGKGASMSFPLDHIENAVDAAMPESFSFATGYLFNNKFRKNKHFIYNKAGASAIGKQIGFGYSLPISRVFLDDKPATTAPTNAPTIPTSKPTKQPTPTNQPTIEPTNSPTSSPTSPTYWIDPHP